MSDSDAFLAALTDEMERLEAELAGSPTYRRLKSLQQVWVAYQGGFPLSADAHTALKRKEPNVGPLHSGRGAVSGPIVAAARELLLAQKRRIESRAITEFVQSKGIVVNGRNPIAAVSSYLSNSPLFDNVKGQGYGLVEWSEATPSGPTAPEPAAAVPISETAAPVSSERVTSP